MKKEKIKVPKKVKNNDDLADNDGFSFIYVLPLIGAGGAAAAAGGGGDSSEPAITFSAVPAPVTISTPAPVTVSTPVQSKIMLGASMSANSAYSFNHVSSNPDVPNWARDRAGTDYILKNIKDAGMNTVVLHFYYSLDTNTDKFFRPTFNTEQLYFGSPTWEALDSAGKRAMDAGLKPVFYMTLNQLPNSQDGMFTYTPKNIENYFSSYKEYLLEVAKLSEKYDSPYMSIGIEMGVVVRDPKYLKYWEDIISSVREIYHGKLTYNSYVDDRHNFNTELDDLTFTHLIDMIGFNLAPQTLDNGEMDGTYEQFYQEWKTDIVPGLQALATKLNKPVFISEFMITRLDGTGSHEFFGSGVGQPIDLKEQADVFDAALKALHESFDTEGIIIWGATDYSRMTNGSVDPYNGLSINWVDAPAEDIISKWMTQYTNSYSFG